MQSSNTRSHTHTRIHWKKLVIVLWRRDQYSRGHAILEFMSETQPLLQRTPLPHTSTHCHTSKHSHTHSHTYPLDKNRRSFFGGVIDTCVAHDPRICGRNSATLAAHSTPTHFHTSTHPHTPTHIHTHPTHIHTHPTHIHTHPHTSTHLSTG
jgi:hypothetical protein